DEATAVAGAGGDVAEHHLQGDEQARRAVAGSVDDSHAAALDLAEQFVVPDESVPRCGVRQAGGNLRGAPRGGTAAQVPRGRLRSWGSRRQRARRVGGFSHEEPAGTETGTIFSVQCDTKRPGESRVGIRPAASLLNSSFHAQSSLDLGCRQDFTTLPPLPAPL